MISKELELILQDLYTHAKNARHELVGLEHLLLAIVQDSTDVNAALQHCGVETALLVVQLQESIDENTPVYPADQAAHEPQPTVGFQRVIQRAMIHVQHSSQDKVLPEDVLIALLDEEDSPAAYFLQLNSVKRIDLLRYFSHRSGSLNAGAPSRSQDDDDNNLADNPLEAYTVHLNAEVQAERIDPLIGREAEMERMLQVLCRRRKNNPLLVGEAGVGKTALAEGRLRCIGATTYDEYRTVFAKDHALSRRFQKIDIGEPSVSETVQILQGLKPMFEAHHNVHYTDDAFQAAAELSAKYINERFLPDKAIDVIDEAGAAQRIAQPENRQEEIGKNEIERIIAKIARIPETTVSHDDKTVLRHLADTLKAKVFGQDEAIDLVATSIKLARSGLGQPDKPIGSFLFSGSTGVGKTEVARQLANALGITLQRFDMSEYSEPFAVTRFIGAPPGYVGFDQGGLLTEAINKHPHCVLLLDEMEKAHPDIYNVFLQVMDAGRLTDNTGKSADFRNVIIIMTTNAGAQNLNRANFGFTGKHERGDEMEAIKKTFTPEFRNRLDAVVPFAPLTPEIILRVADKFLAQLGEQLAAKNVAATFGSALREHLAAKGFDPQMGARPMQRLIQSEIRQALADELLFGKLANGGSVAIDWDNEAQKVVLEMNAAKAAPEKEAV